MVDIDKLAQQVTKLTNDVHRLQQSHLEVQKELIRYKLQERLKEWKEESAHLVHLLTGTMAKKLTLH